ncbi:MAG: acetyl-CoA carboxylase carboxyltransferase subunit alpha [Sphingomonadaceae bacterium]|uniref:acetyl-CoA carboxylase carboxyltransferase subunit alpha n=1 Tax=Thermaurantiacus sp. TaxID=2820283 RepID=UPI00298F17CC|nr:acetyl-CoA carboxylase carboxyltransferase subunit alpha [Thermaurantiacus sp.]MCS6986944.1 acetyl-CoA carboxylase carboxyltransferase subunit alpha [Sphingomonadaceae bacterium]MDW8415456.1 acetyl-CoA carboxylase carboxyltransferase subunit alpha [Thermaurantiacus sp.]
MKSYLDFEGAVAALEAAAERAAAAGDTAEAQALAERAHRQLKDLYSRLSAWQRTQVARHPGRPHIPHYLARMFTEFVELAGDRRFGDDPAITAGLARFRGRAVAVIGHAKGEDTASRLRHNFGMARPEGYRKAQRVMDLADRFGLPVITLVDTPGAFPGVDAEARGQAEAIARTTDRCLALGVPLVAVIVGEGGSGGAVAIATGNRVLMLEHSVYSVISPEGCASILWRSTGKGNSRAAEAAEAMRITAADLLRLGVIDRIVYEPVGGAHRDHELTITRVATAVEEELAALEHLAPEELRRQRREKFLAMGRQGQARW